MPDFTHLHLHTQYSILDGAVRISDLMVKAKEYGMDAVAITDHGNMFGVLKFFLEARNAGLKPILGCEIYVAEGSRFEKRARQGRGSYHLILLAKNKEGYHNLARLTSLGFLEGFYYTPRVDKELLKQYSKGIIATSTCLGGEIPSAILNKGVDQAEQVLLEYLDIFGEDFYLELQRHGLPEQDVVNTQLIALARKHNVPLVAANDVHFIKREDYDAHKILICLNTGKDLDDADAMHYSGQEYFKSPDEMAALFADIPEAIENTRAIVEKIEAYEITQKNVNLPHFPIPAEYTDENEYLRYLTLRGAEWRYEKVDDVVKQRLDYELGVIHEMGFAGYFLIVQDFVSAARNMGVIVGPGRGSAAGSAVAYCLGITLIDPIKYNLLFERFLNPERISMPDMDIDFDDDGRDKVFRYVVEKYGEQRVAQIVTFGTMAARLAIRDVARVLKLPLNEADRIAKLIPEIPGITLAQSYKSVKELDDIRKSGDEILKKTLAYAETLEGSARQTGTHACGIIIGPDDLINHIPLSTARDSDMMITQYEGKLVESVGMLKMDILGLKTLSIIKDAMYNIQEGLGIKIDIEKIPIDDKKTFKLYQKGDTVGTFQFESEGMRNYLRELKPNDLEDLIAMNALFRPGPLDYIPTYIRRKHGKEKVEYPHPLLEEILKPTYGIMVYQEQIMQTAQLLGGFTLGRADILRKAMGKKQKDVMEQQKVDFVAGAAAKGIPEDKASEVYEIMGEFAKYGFNRSHAAAYSVVAYQTGYLKANYPAEYMAAVLTHNLSDIKKITMFIDECRHRGIDVIGPDINESDMNFTVNKQGSIRFGLAAIKGVGEATVKDIIIERKKNGSYASIFDLAKRSNLRSLNRRQMESLAMAGAFDGFPDSHRAQYFFSESNEEGNFLDKIIKHAQLFQERENSSQVSLFGGMEQVDIKDPPMPPCQAWSRLEQLNFEKEVTGFYISGHPLDDYRLEMEQFTNVKIQQLKEELNKFTNKDVKFGGMITAATAKTAKNGNPMGTLSIEDYSDNITLTLFSEDYLRLKHFLEPGAFIMVHARVQINVNRNNQINIRVQNIHLLADVVEKFTKSLEVRLPLETIDKTLIKGLKSLVTRHKGSHRIDFVIHDGHDENMSVTLPSKSFKVHAPVFVKELQLMRGVSFIIKQ